MVAREGSSVGYVALTALLLIGVGSAAEMYQQFCYIGPESQYRQGAGRFTIQNLSDVTLCTHLVYAHAHVDPGNLDLLPIDQNDFNYYKQVTSLRATHPDLRVILSVGGPQQSTEDYAVVLNSTEAIDQFSAKVFFYLRDFGFDGVELDWRYSFVNPPENSDAFTVLCKRMVNTFDSMSLQAATPKPLLTVRVTGDRDIMAATMPVQDVAMYADYIMLGAYDYYSDVPLIGHHSGLYGRASDLEVDENLRYISGFNVDTAVKYLTHRQVPTSKIILGIPFYGRTAYFVNSTMKAFGVAHGGAGDPGPYTQKAGILAYYEICSLIAKGWTEFLDEQQLTPVALSDEEIVTYDNPTSVAIKANYVKDMGLAGASVFDLSYDDFSGEFCGAGPFPLASALKSTFTKTRSSCYPGEYGQLDKQGCEPCPLGQYQPLADQTSCIQCPAGTTTLSTGNVADYKCLPACPSGTEYNYVTSACDPCPLGFYRQEGRDMACLKCPDGQTTVATNSRACVTRPAGVPENTPRQIDVLVHLSFDTTSCENKPVIVGAVRMLVSDYFLRLAQTWPGLCAPGCQNIGSDVIKGCDVKDGYDVSRRRKRQADEKLVVNILVANVSEEVNSTSETRLTANVIAAALFEKSEFEPLLIYGIRYTKINSLDIRLVCEPGSAPKNGRCSQCEAGTYHNTTSGTCAPCPVGHYQNVAGQNGCWPCEGVMSTVTTGATSADECVSPCQARPAYCYNEGICHWTEADRGTVYCECLHEYQGERCGTAKIIAESDNTGTVVGGVVGGVLAFLIVVLVIVTCCVCFRVRKAVKLRHIQAERSNSVQSNNHYMTWGSYSGKTTTASQRGVKFVDYIDYYMWLSTLSEQQQQQQPSQTSHRRHSKQSSPKTQSSTVMNMTERQPTPQSRVTANGDPTISIETNVDSTDKSDQE